MKLFCFFTILFLQGIVSIAAEKDASFIDHRTVSDQVFSGVELNRKFKNLSHPPVGRVVKARKIYLNLLEPVFLKLKREFNFDVNFSKFRSLILDIPIRECSGRCTSCADNEQSCALFKKTNSLGAVAIFINRESYQNDSYNELFKLFTQAGVEYFKEENKRQLRSQVGEWVLNQFRDEIKRFSEIQESCISHKLTKRNLQFLSDNKLIKRGDRYWFECGIKYQTWVNKINKESACLASRTNINWIKNLKLKDVFIPTQLGDLFLCGKDLNEEQTDYQLNLERSVKFFYIDNEVILILPETTCEGKSPQSINRVDGIDIISDECKLKLDIKNLDLDG